MAKYVITTAQVIKRVYVVDALDEVTAKNYFEIREPKPKGEPVSLDEQIFSIENINEYEYNTVWKQPKQREMFEESNDIWRDD